MNLLNKVKKLSAAAAFGAASLFVAVPAAHADDPVLLGKLDRETSKNLKNANAQVQAAKKQMGAGIRG